MTLSDGEKLILYMLSDLYKSLKVEGEIDPGFVCQAIISGNLWGLQERYGGLFATNDTEPAVVTEVVNFLDMWSILEEHLERFSAGDRTRVKSEAFGADHYQGFDGNHDHEHRGVARFLIEDLGRFSRFKARVDLNSHSQATLPKYRAMYAVFEPMRTMIPQPGFSADDIIRILNARAV